MDGRSVTLAIVVTYNGEQYIGDCIQSLIDMDDCDILVIDNYSTDDSRVILQNFGDDIALILNEENQGFGQANNQGFRYARDRDYEAVLLVNQDTVSTPTMLSQLRQVALQYPEIGLLSPMHYNDGQTLDPYFESYIRQTNDVDKRYNGDEDLLSIDFVNAAFWYLPMRTLRIVGGFDPLFFLYGEDNDYVHRIHYHGLTVVVYTKAVGYHLDRHQRQEVESASDYERYLLVGLKNVNDGWLKSVLKFGYDAMVILFDNLRRGQIVKMKFVVVAVLRLMGKYPRIYRSRQQKGEFKYLD